MRSKLVKDISFVALFTAFLCVLGGLSIPVEPVAITLATLGVYIIGSLLSPTLAVSSVCAYIVLGAIGLPVFSNFRSGLAVLGGPTGGYIVGYIFGVLIQSLLITLFKKKLYVYPLAMVANTIVIYVIGSIWFAFYLNNFNFIYILSTCVVPFLIGDSLKIVVATSVCYKLRPVIDKALLVKA